MQRINKLDGLRGLFALFVVLFHLNINNAPAALVNQFFIRESYIFVDFFFILSGYVIALSYDQSIQNGKQFIHFIKKRFIRLYPLLLFSTCMYWYFVHPHFDKQNILQALDTLLLTNSTPILGTSIGMNYPSWSISSEMISYIAFACCSLIAMQKRKTTLIGILTISCFIFLAYLQNYFQTGAFGFIRGLACFNLGYLIFVLTKKQFQLPNYLEIVIIIGIIAMMYFHYIALIQNNKMVSLIQFIIPIALATSILVFIKTKGLIGKILQSSPILFLGRISYSVYLNQALVIGYLTPKIFKWIHYNNGEINKAINVSILLVVLVLYSWCTQYLIEQKLGKKLLATSKL